MKKVSLMIAALALVLGLSQCKKDEKPVASGEKQHIVLSASLGDSNSKIAEDGIGGLKWTDENGGTADVIKVYNSSKEEIGTLTCKNAANGTFEGDITTATGDITFTFGEQKFTEQTGALNDAISLSATTAYDPTGNYNVTMTMPHAVLKLDLSAFADDTKGAGVPVTITSGEVTLASVTGITANSKAVYVALPADGTESKKYTFSNENGMNAEKTWTLAANIFYTKSGSTTGEAIVIPAYPVGALPGLFTVGMDGSKPRKVYFSQGNLQYDKSTSKWQFATNQWETVETGNVSADYANESVIGLFGWGTSGYNYGATCYQPWSTNSSTTAYGPSSGNLTLEGNSDWGKNIGDGKTWRTLTGGENGEWYYLINTRKVNGATGYGNTCVWATVEGVGGLIIFHDGYKGATSGLTSIPDGCVFLPAAGYRNGSLVYRVGSRGRYWSSSYGDSSRAYYLYFSSDDVTPYDNSDRCYGLSVRLVSEN